jgi:alcohol dehydrogenase class IV
MPTSPTLKFDLLVPARTIFGWGRRIEAGQLACTLGNRAFLVSGSRSLERSDEFAQIAESLQRAGVTVVRLATISREPLVSDVDDCVERLLQSHPATGDLVIGLGGGSAIDLAKAVAAMATNRHGKSVKDFLEGVGSGLKIESPPLPVLAIPTTAGTGSEATKNSVISSNDPPFKKSLRSELMVPRIVLIDPELTVNLPAKVTAQTGMDAITQLIESYLSKRAQPIPQALAESGLRLALRSIEAAVAEGANREARESMACAAYLSGIALANSGLGMAHGVAAALGIHCHVSHGLACAVMLPPALRINRDARLKEIARLSSLESDDRSQDDGEAADRFIARIEELTKRIGIPSRLSEIGVKPDQITAIVKGSRGNSMDGNPREVSDRELSTLLESML